MAEITMSDTIEITDPKLQNIATQILNTLKVETEKAFASQADAAYKLPADPNSVEQTMLTYFNKYPADKKVTVAKTALSMVTMPTAKRAALYGNDLGGLDLKKAVTIDSQFKATATFNNLLLPANYLSSINGNILGGNRITGGGVIPPTPQLVRDKLELRIHRVMCNDETDPEWWGDDSIAIAGIATNAASATSNPIGERFVGSFSDGRYRDYTPPMSLHIFNLRDGANTWPKYYSVALLLAEKDSGGFSTIINRLFDQIRARVDTYLRNIRGFWAQVAAVVWNVVKRLLDWIRNLFADDVFDPVIARIGIPSMEATWANGATDGPELQARFVGHGGTYTVTYDWRLFV
ncbi:MAG: hypothetical protein PHE17_00550 [Thiothrix sp.]|uniref:hypothetical protein n=1 Tax=Thiothrix sp. TaxID=1032 RepID=UPI002637B385|nr:hypothetical protein [Thiothrix sp.]MDD5391482.1 hypothetical protein [Thiothrix sp.]